ncbi:hypothetical protein EV286_101492 [Rhizobium sp. BK251]|nr:hypothetical protein EV286_101492 [Rhizobium sp. BK251]
MRIGTLLTGFFLMPYLFGFVDASRMQSIFQLGVAICLAYLVAGPEILKIVALRLRRLQKLNGILDVLISEGGNSEDIAARKFLVHTTEGHLKAAADAVVPTNASTSLFYACLASLFFAGLVYSSFFSEMPMAVAVLSLLLVAVALFMDPYRVWRSAKKFEAFADRIQRVLNTMPSHEGSQTATLRVKAASAIVSKLRRDQQTIDEAIRNLDQLFSA